MAASNYPDESGPEIWDPSSDTDNCENQNQEFLLHGQCDQQGSSELVPENNFIEMSASELEEALAEIVKHDLQVFKAVIRWALNLIKSEKELFTTELLQQILDSVIPLFRFQDLSERELRLFILPLNIIKSGFVENIIANLNPAEDPRKSVPNIKTVDLDQQILMTELEKSKAAEFLLNFQLETQIHNERLVNQKLLTKIERQEGAYKEFKESPSFDLEFLESLNSSREKELFDSAKSANLHLQAKLDSQAKELTAVKETVVELRRGLFKSNKSSTKSLINRFPLEKLIPTIQFKNTEDVAIAFVVKNASGTSMEMKENYFELASSVEFENIAVEIPTQQMEIFGFTRADELSGFFSYRIDTVLLVVNYFIRNNHNNLTLAFCPANIGITGDDLLEKLLSPGNWSGYEDRTCEYESTRDLAKDKEFNLNISLGNLHATATMATGRKALVTVEVTDS